MAALRNTPGVLGKVLLLPGEKSVFDLNGEYERALVERRREFWEKTPKAEALEAVRASVGVRPIADLPAPKMDEAGRVDRNGYHIDKFVLHTGSGVPLPGLTYHPAKPVDDAYLYLHEDGKAADGAPGGPIEKLVQAGNVVVAIDLRGIGETAGGEWWLPRGIPVLNAPANDTTEAIDESLLVQMERVIKSPDVELPRLPRVAQRALALIGSENTNYRKLSELISQDPVLSADVLPSIGRWTIPALGPGEFTAKVYAMAGGKYATVADVVTWTVEGDPPGSPPTPSDAMIPPVEDAALEYEA